MGAMEKLTSVLAVVDRIEAADMLLAKSVALARHFSARVGVLLRDPTYAHSVATLCAQRAYGDLSLTVDRRANLPLAEVIVDAVQDAAADFVIKAPMGVHPLGRALLHATDRRVAGLCPVPLMLAGPRGWSPEPRFAAALDVRDTSRTTLARAIVHTAGFLALGCQAELDVVYSEREINDERVRMERAVRLAQVVREFHIGSERLRLLTGPPDETVTAFGAHGSYDVLILGAVTQRTGLPTMFASLTSQLVDAFNCDVVLVKDDGQSVRQQRLDEAQ
jgi:nucleotide-binding universal stress UspA family protein